MKVSALLTFHWCSFQRVLRIKLSLGRICIVVEFLVLTFSWVKESGKRTNKTSKKTTRENTYYITESNERKKEIVRKNIQEEK